jgi:hypothetical protein
MSPAKLLRLLVIPCLISCQEDPISPISLKPTMEVGDGLSELLPHQQEGTRLTLSVNVTVAGHPATGLEVFWSDGNVWSGLSDSASITDVNGVAKTVWTLPQIPANLPWATYSVQAALPGAAGSPVVYTLEVYRCTRC